VISRVRIEAIERTEELVKSNLLAAFAALKEHTGGEWDIEGEQTQTAKNEWWGFLTVRRTECF
jgi:hypothetical protein